MISPLAKQLMSDGLEASHPYSIGYRTSYLPALGEKIWESTKESLFSAYIFRSPKNKLIGYIRMPNYVCSIQDEGRSESKDTAECLKEFAEVMAKFEKVTDGLVIDQLNNPGGSVFYLYALASTLTDQPLFAPRHRMAVSQENVFEGISNIPELEKVTNDEEAKKLVGESLEGYPVSYQVVQYIIQYFRFMSDEFKAGRKLTTPYYIWGVDQINPHPTSRYTKPVLMLVNSLDFSGGDFFPAILQDNKRITVMGTRTAGAGGYVGQLSYPNLFGVASFSLTGSIAERINKRPIENLGVTPDVPYELTVKDLQDGYKDYLKSIRKQIDSMVK
jgi:C-terminal processing protease CtpA/Prc